MVNLLVSRFGERHRLPHNRNFHLLGVMTMFLKSIVRLVTIISLLVAALGLTALLPTRKVAAQTPTPFLITPYFGTHTISSYFDHEYPTYHNPPNGDGTPNGDNRIFTRYDNNRWVENLNLNPPLRVDINGCNNGYGNNCYDGHNGIDFSGPFYYEHVIAAADGTVTRAGWDSNTNRGYGYGLVVEIRHDNNSSYVTRYGHLSAINVQVNQQVRAGQIIGTSGNTGASTGAHLHFGVMNSLLRAVDPFGPPANDPWAQQPQGATSSCLWVDGQWANICGGISRPIPEPISGGELPPVDDTPDNLGGFSKGSGGPFNNPCTGNCGGWTSAAVGYGSDMYFTPADGGSTASQWAKWQPQNIPAVGAIYEVFIYVPSNNATTWQAPYVIKDGTGQTVATGMVDQYGLSNQWVSIGTYFIAPGYYVYTTDAT
jgi:murein DD-endopeptidase MepM/ murein hydrolase activator NlpD